MKTVSGNRQYDITHATVPVRGENTPDEKMLRRKRKAARKRKREKKKGKGFDWEGW
jgi:hypothetical protein